MAYFGKEIKGDILRVLEVLNVLILTNIVTKLREDQGQEILPQELNDIFYNIKLMKQTKTKLTLVNIEAGIWESICHRPSQDVHSKLELDNFCISVHVLHL